MKVPCCKKKDLVSKLLKADMFGKTKSSLKNIKLKTCLAKSLLSFLLFLIVYFFFLGHAYEVEFRFPEEKHLSEGPGLRSEDGRIIDPHLRDIVVPYLQEQCTVMQDVDILFCFQLSIDARPLYSPCFIDCRNKVFYHDLKVMETDSPGSVKCIEAYSTLELTKERAKNVVIKGLKGVELEEFVSVPSTTIDNCLLQHANEVVRGLWLN